MVPFEEHDRSSIASCFAPTCRVARFQNRSYVFRDIEKSIQM
jgi:hypothetical protein